MAVDGGSVDVGVAVAQLLLYFYLLQAVVTLDQLVICPKIKHLLSTGSHLLSMGQISLYSHVQK